MKNNCIKKYYDPEVYNIGRVYQITDYKRWAIWSSKSVYYIFIDDYRYTYYDILGLLFFTDDDKKFVKNTLLFKKF